MHDQSFKNLILDYPREALQFFAQDEITDDLSQARIIPIRQEQLQERLGERFRELDTPLLVEWPDGKREALLFVIEEETQTARFSIHRLAHYCLDLAELMQTDRVVPVVIFLNTGNRPDHLTLGGDKHRYLTFRYLACDLKRLPAEHYKDSDNIVARLNLPNMQHPRQQRLQLYLAAQLGLVRHETNPDKIRKYSGFIDYYADLTEQEFIEYQQHYQAHEGEIMGMTQIWKEQGIQQGLLEGLQKGKQEGLQQGKLEGKKDEALRLLGKQIQLKYGPLPDWVKTQLDQADLDQLEHWAERILTAETLDDLLRG